MKPEFDFGKFIYKPFISNWILKLLFRIPEWKTDYNAALTEASQSNKVVFALFTSPDWCGHCIDLDMEVLTSGLFNSWADKRVVLLKLEFLKYTQLPAALVQQNQMLAKKYQVQGYPAAIGLNSDGTERGRFVGYSKGTGAKNYLIQFETNAKMNQSPAP